MPTLRPPDEPPGFLADAVDPATGDYLSIEWGFDPTDAAVLTALERVRGSGGAVLDIGQRFADQELVDDKAASFLEQEVRRALAHLIDARQIRLTRVVVRANPGEDFAEVGVFYFNIARQEERKPFIPLRTLLGSTP